MIRAGCTEMALQGDRWAQERFGAPWIEMLWRKPSEKAGRQNQSCLLTSTRVPISLSHKIQKFKKGGGGQELLVGVSRSKRQRLASLGFPCVRAGPLGSGWEERG